MNEDQKPIMTEQELWEWLHYDEGIPVTRRAVKHAVLRREISPTRLGNTNLFSRRDGWDWIESRKQSGVYRLPKSAVAQ
ncbi:hypothetical protein H7J51_06940 [Mycobacterium crocinum]|nr:hypothetical protein [Mycolicibacterium crocinum]